MFPTRYPSLRFTYSTSIGHWSSGCHNRRVKDSFGCMYGVCDDNDAFDIVELGGLI